MEWKKKNELENVEKAEKLKEEIVALSEKVLVIKKAFSLYWLPNSKI